MKFKFEKLIIWQKTMDFGEVIYHLSANFSDDERFNLVSQIRRAVDSIALNISEGAIGQSNLELKKFMGYAIRSLAEVVTCLHKAKRREHKSLQEFDKFYTDSFNLINMMIAFKKVLNELGVGSRKTEDRSWIKEKNFVIFSLLRSSVSRLPT